MSNLSKLVSFDVLDQLTLKACFDGISGSTCLILSICLLEGFKDSIKSFTTKGNDSSFKSNRNTTSTTPKNKANSLGLNAREIIVYSICAGAFAFVIVLCIACQRRYKNIYGNFKKNQTESKKGRNKPEISLPDIPLEGIEDIYEVIDESNMIENHENISDISNSVTNANDRYWQPVGNDYLTPYQSTGEGSNSNDSNDNHTEYSATTNLYNETTNDHNSTSSSPDVHGRISNYFIQYVPIINPADNDIQEYVFPHNANDSGSSGSETQMRISGYLNPYQPIIIPARDSHEYKSLNGCSDGLGLSSSDTSI
ncbi:unnamed protein product [Mytilus coruscus]|uniref:Uncharacterized protein n=1 Tax=Mytilus coruscus TaxID=42192 RepID=A0A6J8BHU7_MYTCO|nr:unnamed protein product [Mytilus coruscus]